jgi:hypothetical protein
MAYANRLECVTLASSQDLSTHQYKIVEMNSSGKAALAALSRGFGVIQNHPLAGEAATVAIDGESKVIAGAALTIGDYVSAKSGGWAVKVNSGDATPIHVIGQVMMGAASGFIGTVLLRRNVIGDVVSGSIVDAV